MKRRSDSPVAAFLVACTFMLVALSAGFVEGQKVRECPAQLEDGRSLRGIDLHPARRVCLYGPPVNTRPLDAYSSVELRRIAAMRDRLARTQPLGTVK